MPRLPRPLPQLVAAETGLRVNTATAGWWEAGSPSLSPAVIVVHDDVIGGCPSRPPGALTTGVRQPTQYVPGPLYNVWIACDLTVWFIAGGRANNAGSGGWAGYTGNSRTIGVCRSFDGNDAGAPPAQTAATAAVCSVLARMYGIPAGNVIGHKEWTTRKSDPHGVNMAQFRAMVAGSNSEVHDMTDEQAAMLKEVHEALTGQTALPYGLRKVLAAAQANPVYLVTTKGRQSTWATDLKTRWELHKFSPVAEKRFGAMPVVLSASDHARFLAVVPERTAAPTG